MLLQVRVGQGQQALEASEALGGHGASALSAKRPASSPSPWCRGGTPDRRRAGGGFRRRRSWIKFGFDNRARRLTAALQRGHLRPASAPSYRPGALTRASLVKAAAWPADGMCPPELVVEPSCISSDAARCSSYPSLLPPRASTGIGPRIEMLLKKALRLPPGVAEPRVIDLLWHTPTGVIDRRATPDDRRRRARHHRHAGGACAQAQAGAARQRAGALQGDLRGRHRPHRPGVLPRRTQVHRAATADRAASATSAAASKATTTSKQMVHPDYIVAPEARADLPMLEPVYPLTAGCRARCCSRPAARRWSASPRLPEWQEPAWLKQRGWPDVSTALCSCCTAPRRPATSRRPRRPGSGSPTTSCWRASWRWPWCGRA